MEHSTESLLWVFIFPTLKKVGGPWPPWPPARGGPAPLWWTSPSVNTPFSEYPSSANTSLWWTPPFSESVNMLPNTSFGKHPPSVNTPFWQIPPSILIYFSAINEIRWQNTLRGTPPLSRYLPHILKKITKVNFAKWSRKIFFLSNIWKNATFIENNFFSKMARLWTFFPNRKWFQLFVYFFSKKKKFSLKDYPNSF